jgi:hypothetical protein
MATTRQFEYFNPAGLMGVITGWREFFALKRPPLLLLAFASMTFPLQRPAVERQKHQRSSRPQGGYRSCDAFHQEQCDCRTRAGSSSSAPLNSSEQEFDEVKAGVIFHEAASSSFSRRDSPYR